MLYNQRDQKALYEKYYGYCLKIVFRYIYRYEKAVDVVNDGFVKLFRKIHLFKCEEASKTEFLFMGWLKTIMINTAIDQLRKDEFLPEIGLVDEGNWIEDRSAASDKALLYEDIIREIKKLPPAYRAVFNMYVIDGYSHQEVARQLGISVGTSKSNLCKARGILQTYIKTAEQVKTCVL